MIESLLSISEFEKLMNSKLKESFGECIRDFRGEKYCVSEQIIKESKEDTRTTKIFLIYEGDTVIFMARLLCGSRCEINMVYTNPLYRGQRYCVNGLRKLVRKTKKPIYLGVRKKNKPAIGCYEKVGFVFSKVENGDNIMIYKKSMTRKNSKKSHRAV
jgi:GNAT superfamily N-acetyltransferase